MTARRRRGMERARVTVQGCMFAYEAERDPEDGWWIGFVPALPGFGSQARTRLELRRMVKDAIVCYLTALHDARATAPPLTVRRRGAAGHQPRPRAGGSPDPPPQASASRS